MDKFKEYGVKFAVEPHPNNMIYDIHTAKRAIELLDGHPNFVQPDPANLIYLGLRVENLSTSWATAFSTSTRRTAKSWSTTYSAAAS